MWFDMGLSLFADALGILITVFLVDRIIKRREEARWKPARYPVYSKFLRFNSRILSALIPFLPFVKSKNLVYGFDKVHTPAITDITKAELSTNAMILEMRFNMLTVDVGKAKVRRKNLLIPFSLFLVSLSHYLNSSL